MHLYFKQAMQYKQYSAAQQRLQSSGTRSFGGGDQEMVVAGYWAADHLIASCPPVLQHGKLSPMLSDLLSDEVRGAACAALCGASSGVACLTSLLLQQHFLQLAQGSLARSKPGFASTAACVMHMLQGLCRAAGTQPAPRASRQQGQVGVAAQLLGMLLDRMGEEQTPASLEELLLNSEQWGPLLGAARALRTDVPHDTAALLDCLREHVVMVQVVAILQDYDQLLAKGRLSVLQLEQLDGLMLDGGQQADAELFKLLKLVEECGLVRHLSASGPGVLERWRGVASRSRQQLQQLQLFLSNVCLGIFDAVDTGVYMEELDRQVEHNSQCQLATLSDAVPWQGRLGRCVAAAASLEPLARLSCTFRAVVEAFRAAQGRLLQQPQGGERDQGSAGHAVERQAVAGPSGSVEAVAAVEAAGPPLTVEQVCALV